MSDTPTFVFGEGEKLIFLFFYESAHINLSSFITYLQRPDIPSDKIGIIPIFIIKNGSI